MALSMSETKDLKSSEPVSTLKYFLASRKDTTRSARILTRPLNYVVMCFVSLLNGLLALPAFTQMRKQQAIDRMNEVWYQ